jgi:hypothetical protein
MAKRPKEDKPEKRNPSIQCGTCSGTFPGNPVTGYPMAHYRTVDGRQEWCPNL